jgi:hypothetical protein
MFVEPGSSSVTISNVGIKIGDQEVHVIHLERFVTALMGHALHWLADHRNERQVRHNLGRFIRRHAQGFLPVSWVRR